ncbi:MAG TPA: serine/threonine-protein kinase, partial [Planctomycetota bacterium]|nr:serine/threonine-protein kinase [Planctomycetota bacterium]
MTLVTCPRCNRQVAGGRFCPGCGSRLDDPLTGKVLAGRVRLVAQTGRGPFYATYRAEHKSGGASWSVKVLEPAVTGDDSRKRRFLENAGAMLALGDARLLPVREMAEEEIADGGARSRRVVFALADAPAGPSLAELIRRQGPLDTARAAAFGQGLLGALGAVHAARVVHGDLHPDCVFLEPDGQRGEQVRLADAGLAIGLGGPPAEAPDPASFGSDGGRWIAPEQAAGQTASAASDLHAAGAVLYFALTGSPPWQSEKGSPLLYEIQKSVPRPASQLQARVPAALDQVLDRALAKSPGDRYRTAAEFAQALASASAGVAAVPRPALPVDVTPGALTMAGLRPTTSEITLTAPPVRRAPSIEDLPPPRSSIGSGDETIVGSPGA